MTFPSIAITSLSSTGEGIGALDGKKIFVDGALPGETVNIQITQEKKNYAKASLLSVLNPSFERTEPLCPLFGECGGCQVMHVQYPAQLEIKRQRVVDALERIGKLQNISVLPCIPSPTSLGYRNKLQLPVVWDNGKKTIGLYRKNTHEVVGLKRCFIQCPQGEEIYHWIAEHLDIPAVRYIMIRNAVFNEEALVIFVTTGRFSKELKKFAELLLEENALVKGVIENLGSSSTNVILGSSYRLLAGRLFIHEKILNKTFKISPSAFFQVNPGQTEMLYQKAIEWADIQSNETVLDAYCGVGALAILAAEYAKHAFGIECVSPAIADAIENARLNELSNCSFFCGKAEEMISEIDQIDVVFLNPPRKGCAPELISSVLSRKPKKIIYISCDPATLARDLALLHPVYKIEQIQPFDMFPQTMHVETLVRLTRV